LPSPAQAISKKETKLFIDYSLSLIKMNKMNSNYLGYPLGKPYQRTGNQQTGKFPSRIVTEYQEPPHSYAQVVNNNSFPHALTANDVTHALADIVASVNRFQVFAEAGARTQQQSVQTANKQPANKQPPNLSRQKFVKTGNGNKGQDLEKDLGTLVATDKPHSTNKVYVHGFRNDHSAKERFAMITALATECGWRLEDGFLESFTTEGNKWQSIRLGLHDHNEASVVVTLSRETYFNRKCVCMRVDVPGMGSI
jgi:hypothetical protein